MTLTVRPRAVTAEEAHRIALVVARTGCTRMTAWAYLKAQDGDVTDACESWRVDHRHHEMPAWPHRAPVSLEASD